jgi:hypothetical protein
MTSRPSTSAISTERLLSLLRPRLTTDARAWLDTALATARTGSTNQLLAVYTGTSRRIGSAPLALDDEERARIAGASAGLVFDRWTLEDAARAALLIASAVEHPKAFVDDATSCYEHGDAREQLSWIRGVCLLPDPSRFTALVIDACRTNILPLFEAVACDNPFPSTHFPELHFNQMVLKALFNGVPLARIIGLRKRRNAELTRMARDYAEERRTAGRDVPRDIALAIGASRRAR